MKYILHTCLLLLDRLKTYFFHEILLEKNISRKSNYLLDDAKSYISVISLIVILALTFLIVDLQYQKIIQAELVTLFLLKILQL